VLAIPGVMAWLVENGPGPGDDALFVFLSLPWIAGGMYLVLRERRPIIHADRRGLTYVPYDDPVARVRYGREVHVEWPEIESVFFELLGNPALVPYMVVTTFDGRRVQLPLGALGLPFEQLAERLQAAAEPHLLPLERQGA
jgi:hypothetical protein